jgi:hypothetical protein
MIIENKLYAPFKNYSSNLISSKYNDVSSIRGNKAHKGTDYAIPSGTQILSPADGVIKTSQITNGNCGGLIEITHPNNIMTRYCHLKKLNVKPNDKVSAGQVIGLSGGAENDIGKGRSTGAHLHFEVLINNQFVNPEEYLSGDIAIFTGATGNTLTNSIPGETSSSTKSYDLGADGSTSSSSRTYNIPKINQIPESVKNDIKNIKRLLKESTTFKSNNLNDIGKKIVSSFTDDSNSEFSDEYTYEAIGKKLYCKFDSCKISGDKNFSGCYKMEVYDGNTQYYVSICAKNIEVKYKSTKKGDKIGEIDSNNDNYSVTVKKGLSTSIKLIGRDKSERTPYKLNFGSTSSSSRTYNLGDNQTSSSSKTYGKLGYGQTSSSNKEYGKLGSGETSSSSKAYKLDKFSPEAKLTKEAVDEINRILEIL